MRNLQALSVLAALGSTVSLQVAAAEPGQPSAAEQWVVLAGLEEKALRDYSWAFTGSDVIDNARQLRDLARSETFGATGESCKLAAQTLSYMVTGRYYSGRRLAVSADWHHFSGDYARQRHDCLSALKVDEQAHPLPDWFGK